MSTKTIALAADHGGFELKNLLKADLEEQGLEVLDLGTNSSDSVDYPDFAQALAEAILDGRAGRGVLVCGTGIGIGIAANRYPEIRAAIAHHTTDARLCRQHNDANVICFGGRTTGSEVARDCLRVFLETEFEGGRHSRRIEKMSKRP